MQDASMGQDSGLAMMVIEMSLRGTECRGNLGNVKGSYHEYQR
jgi:hypothetical protein